MIIILAIGTFSGFYILKLLTVPPVYRELPIEIIELLAILVMTVASLLSISLWRWYDKMLYMFSKSLRFIDLVTWVLLFWFLLIQYQNYNGTTVNVSQMPVITKYLNAYFWGGLTAIGFIVIGIVRFFREDELF